MLAALGLLLGACTTGPVTPTPPAGPPVAQTAAAPVASPAPAPAAATAVPDSPPIPDALARAATQDLLRFHERVRELPATDVAREITRLEARLTFPQPPASAPAAASPAAPAPASALPASGAASGPAGLRVGGDPAAPGATDALARHSLELALLLAQQRQSGDLARALALLEPLQRPGAPAATQPLARLLHARLSEQRRLEEQLERQAQTVRELQRRADQLAAQLEALRAIERSLNTRPPAPAAPAAPGTPTLPQAGPR